MLLSPIKILKHNINQEILVIYSNEFGCKGYYLKENFYSALSINVTISTQNKVASSINSKFICLSADDISKFSNGDVILFRPNGSLFLIFKSTSQDNALFVTEQCNNHCLMCSQPPRKYKDIDYYFDLNSKLINLLPKDLNRLGITGGEPTLLGDKLFYLLTEISKKLPNTSIHLLSNGRQFSDILYVKEFSCINICDILIGIPLHSDFNKDHDQIAQSKGAYNETLKGLYNLARFNQNIELRIVINRINYKRLPQIAKYIYRNLPFSSHIAFMALEYTGFVPKNNQKIWIDPTEYKNELETAVLDLASWGLNVSIFNLPLCLLKNTLYKYAKKSISAWKIKYLETCIFCNLKNECGGIFGTSLKNSPNIAAIQ